MSGHSKWSQIKRKKAVVDKERAKLFSRLAKQITIAARLNKNLDIAVANAKAANMPKDNIERAISRGQGLSTENQLEEYLYEVYGPGGAGILIKVITDNKNRSVSEIRSTLNKFGGQLAGTGAVQFLFDLKGIIELSDIQAIDEAQLQLIDAGAEDFEADGNLIVYTAPDNLAKLTQIVKQQEYKIASSHVGYQAKIRKQLEPDDQAKLWKLLEALEDLDDVDEVYTDVE